MKSFKTFIVEGPVVDMTQRLVTRMVQHFHKYYSPKGYRYAARSNGSITTHAWRKGSHHFEVQHNIKDPHWYKWGHAKVVNGQLRFFTGGQDPLRGDHALGAPDFRKK